MYFKNRADITKKYNRTISDVSDQIKTVNKAVSLKNISFYSLIKHKRLKQLSGFYQKFIVIKNWKYYKFIVFNDFGILNKLNVNIKIL